VCVAGAALRARTKEHVNQQCPQLLAGEDGGQVLDWRNDEEMANLFNTEEAQKLKQRQLQKQNVLRRQSFKGQQYRFQTRTPNGNGTAAVKGK